jgi:uridine kinase
MDIRNEHFLDFSKELYGKLCLLNNGIREMELYEFRYALEYIKSEVDNWAFVNTPLISTIEKMIRNREFYESIELKPQKNNKIILDKNISDLNKSLFAGIVKGDYNLKWIDRHFYFDVRGFIFIPRTKYFTEEVLQHLREEPFMRFKSRQDKFDSFQGIGFRDFKNANIEIDRHLLDIINTLCRNRRPPVIIAVAGPTAAGKTEFSEYLLNFFNENKKTIKSVEIDNFLQDREYRDAIGSGKMIRESVHFDLFKNCLEDLKKGDQCQIPRYDFTNGVSSHDKNNKLRNGASTITIESTDIIFLEGNFPFLFDEIIPLIDIKIFYLTDDPIRLKRKWKRDIDYRKKYNPNYFCNRYFRTQYLKAETSYRSQLKTCDIAVDTTEANIYISHNVEKELNKE